MSYDHLKTTRESKNTARQMAVDSTELTPRKVALFITVPGVPDIKEALKTGLINAQTKIIAVNHCRKDRNSAYDADIALKIKQNLTELGLQGVIVDDFFESSRGLRMIKDISKKWGNIDYAFIDLCGLATPSLCHAINTLQASFTKKARIALTICTRVRRPQLIIQWQRAFYGELDIPALKILSTPSSSEWLSEMFGEFNNTRASVSTREIRTKHVNNFLWQFQAVVASFDEYVTHVQSAMQYCDSTSMGLVVFDISYQDGGNQLFHYIKDACDKSKKPRSNRNPSLTFSEKT